MMQRLPAGEQFFTNLRESQMIYVDKASRNIGEWQHEVIVPAQKT